MANASITASSEVGDEHAASGALGLRHRASAPSHAGASIGQAKKKVRTATLPVQEDEEAEGLSSSSSEDEARSSKAAQKPSRSKAKLDPKGKDKAASSSNSSSKDDDGGSDDDENETDVETRMALLESRRWETEKHAPLVGWMKDLLPEQWHAAAGWGRDNPTDDAHYDPDRYRLAIPIGDDWILVRGCFRCEAAKRLCVLEPNNKRCKSCATSRKFCGRKLTFSQRKTTSFNSWALEQIGGYKRGGTTWGRKGLSWEKLVRDWKVDRRDELSTNVAVREMADKAGRGRYRLQLDGPFVTPRFSEDIEWQEAVDLNYLATIFVSKAGIAVTRARASVDHYNSVHKTNRSLPDPRPPTAPAPAPTPAPEALLLEGATRVSGPRGRPERRRRCHPQPQSRQAWVGTACSSLSPFRFSLTDTTSIDQAATTHHLSGHGYLNHRRTAAPPCTLCASWAAKERAPLLPIEAPNFPDFSMSLADIRLFGAVSYAQVAALDPPPTSMALCKVPGTYALHYDLAGLKPLSLPPPADADEAQYHGLSLNPPERKRQRVRSAQRPTSRHLRAAGAARGPPHAYMTMPVLDPNKAAEVLARICAMLAALNPTTKQYVQCLLITAECLFTGASRSCRVDLVYHQALAELLGPASMLVIGLNTDSCLTTAICCLPVVRTRRVSNCRRAFVSVKHLSVEGQGQEDPLLVRSSPSSRTAARTRRRARPSRSQRKTHSHGKKFNRPFVQAVDDDEVLDDGVAAASEEREAVAKVEEGDSEEKSGAADGRDFGAETSGSVVATSRKECVEVSEGAGDEEGGGGRVRAARSISFLVSYLLKSQQRFCSFDRLDFLTL